MFDQLAAAFQAQAGDPAARSNVFLVHPVQLARWLDEAWAARSALPPIPGASTQRQMLGSLSIIDDLDLPSQPSPTPLLAPSGIRTGDHDAWDEVRGPTSGVDGARNAGFIWDHLILAYLLESSGVLEIVAAVMKRLVNGEGLGQLSSESVKWLRTTEELFFRDPPLYSITGVISELRPYSRINRRQAYWRMFGFDLPHRVPGGVPGASMADTWKSSPGLTANRDFREKWTELLRQVWLGLENRSNASGANPADPSYIALLCQALQDMMNDRRKGGLLAREEFCYVAVLSWFELTLAENTPIVVDLKAQGSSPEERLRALAARVGMEPAGSARELFKLAKPASNVMLALELGLFSTPQTAATLFTATSGPARDMNDVVNLWQSATGDRVKERPTGTPSKPAQPVRIPAPAAVSAGNGTKP